MNRLLNSFVTDWPEILMKTQEHLVLSLFAVVAACVIAIPLGIYLTNNKRLAQPILAVVSIIQTIPSLAMFGFMIPLFGIGVLPAGIALTLYALLPVLQNTYVGISEVDSALNRVRLWNGNDKMAGASDGSTSGGKQLYHGWCSNGGRANH